MSENIITESFNEDFMRGLINSEKYSALNVVGEQDVFQIMQNTKQATMNAITEGTLTQDVAVFTKILLPIIRRVYPNLIAHNLLGVQPMSGPTGYIYAWVNKYTGDHTNGVSPSGKCVIVELEDDQTSANVGDEVNTDGKLLHKEGKLALISVGTTTVTVDSTQIGGKTVKKIFTNEAAFGNILKNYTGPYATSAAEVLGDDMRELGFEVTKKAIEVRSRAVKTPFTIEMYQDLKAQHGQIADEELISLISYELQAEIDREIVAAVNSWAKPLANTKFSEGSDKWAGAPGRWEIERFRAEAIRIDKEAALVGVANKRGCANTLLVSPKVAVMLKQLGNFSAAPVANNINIPAAGGVAGVYDGRYTVIVDQYAQSDYVTALYKGSQRVDAIGFYAPYAPITYIRVTDPSTAQPAIVGKTRYALTATPGVSKPDDLDRAQTYASSWGIDFANTVLA